jgi:hypothetical protein
MCGRLTEKLNNTNRRIGMKHRVHRLLILVTTLNTFALVEKGKTDDFSIIIESKWQDLEKEPAKAKEFGGKLILVGSITLKKRSKEHVSLSKIYLRWNGCQIENLIGSLYKKELDKDFHPIEEYLVCDGVWNKNKQRLLFEFDEKQTLGPTNIFYLVLTVPEELEKTLKNGSFEIEHSCLPELLQQCTVNQELALSIDVPVASPSH